MGISLKKFWPAPSRISLPIRPRQEDRPYGFDVERHASESCNSFNVTSVSVTLYS